MTPVGANSRSSNTTSTGFAFLALLISDSSLRMISSTGMGDQSEDRDFRKYEMVSSSAEISLSTSIILLIHSVTCNMAQYWGCNAVHLSRVGRFPTAPRRLPARREQIARWCPEVFCQSLVQTPGLRPELRSHGPGVLAGARSWNSLRI